MQELIGWQKLANRNIDVIYSNPGPGSHRLLVPQDLHQLQYLKRTFKKKPGLQLYRPQIINPFDWIAIKKSISSRLIYIVAFFLSMTVSDDEKINVHMYYY